MATAVYSRATDMLPDDVLTAVFELARQSSKQEQLSFRGHDSRLQRLFWELAQKSRSRFLEPFVFSDTGPEPYSPVLSESISRLQLSGFMGRGNPDYDDLFLKPAAKQYFDRELSRRLSEDDIKELRRVADQFLRLVNI